jgi:hypothetical protein
LAVDPGGIRYFYWLVIADRVRKAVRAAPVTEGVTAEKELDMFFFASRGLKL